VYRRRLGERTLSFGVSGMLYKNSLLMFDNETTSVWSHITGEALAGPLVGETLEQIAIVPHSPWAEVRKAYPEVRVLSVGGAQTASRDTYAEYRTAADKFGMSAAADLEVDARLPGKAMVVGVSEGDEALAAPWSVLEMGRALSGELGDLKYVIAMDSRSRTAVVFDRRLDDRVLEFEPRVNDGRLRDRTTKSVWDLMHGEAVSGPLKGRRLDIHPFLNVYWFAWSDFHPEAKVLQP